jgi:hypothetical protein
MTFSIGFKMQFVYKPGIASAVPGFELYTSTSLEPPEQDRR